MLREILTRILTDYPTARRSPLEKHSLAIFIREAPPRELMPLAKEPERYKVEGSPGQGNWAKVPWISVFDLLVTDSAQRGYYPVYLFRSDMLGVYLSLNQGVTNVRKLYGRKARSVLRSRAQEFRAALGTGAPRFDVVDIDLALPKSDTASYYEDGNIAAVYYDRANIPPDTQLVSDLLNVLGLYRLLVDKYAGALPLGEDETEDDEDPSGSTGDEDASKRKLHARIERNRTLARRAKKWHGYRCQSCDTQLDEVYGSIAKKIIEAHHLIPLSALNGKKVSLDPKKDFAVLCPNCHRVIHKSAQPENVPALRRLLRESLLRSSSQNMP